MNIFAIGIITSLLFYLAIGSYAGRKVKHLDDYYVAGRGAPTLLIVGTLVASFLSTTAFLGETGFSYQGHAPQLFIMTGINSLGYVVGALFFGRYLRRSNVLTVAEFFGRRFNSHRVQVAAGVTIVFGITAYLLAVTQGASLIISEVMEIPYGQTVFIVWLSYTLFTLYSGSRGVVITDTLMFLLFTVVSFIAVYYIVNAAGGLSESIHALATNTFKPGILSWHGVIGPDSRWQTPFDAVAWSVVLGLSWGFVVAVSPWQSSRYLMAKNEHTVIRSACIASGSLLVLYIVLICGATAINLANPNIDPAERAMIWAAFNLMPALPGVLLMAGITAAALSSASTFLSLIGFSASHDLVAYKNVGEQQQLKITRITMLAIGLIILLIAYFQPPAIFIIAYFAGTLFASSWGPVAFMSIWSKRITADAAFWGIVTGFAGNIIAKLLDIYEITDLPIYLDPFIIGLILSTVTILLVSRMGSVSEEEKEFLAAIHQTPEQEMDNKQANTSIAIAKYLVLTAIIVFAVLLIFYLKPYQQIMMGDQRGIAISGELLMISVYSGALLFSGLLARYWLKRSYRKKGA